MVRRRWPGGLSMPLQNLEKLLKRQRNISSMLLQQPLASLIATKDVMRRSQGDISGVVSAELNVFAELLGSEETRSRIHSLLKK